MGYVKPEDVAHLLGAPLAEYLIDQIPREAKRLKTRRVPVDDLEQVMWESALRRAAYLKKEFDENRRFVNRKLRDAGIKLLKEDDRYVRSCKAIKAGYAVGDEEFYSMKLLEHILPALIDAKFDVAVAMRRATEGTDNAGVHINISDPFSGAENYQCMLLDITVGWKRLSEGQRRLLSAYYSAPQGDTQDARWERQRLAASMGLTEETLRKRANRSVRALQDKLGGETPW